MLRTENRKVAEFPLPKLEAGKKPVNSRVGFEGRHFRRRVGN